MKPVFFILLALMVAFLSCENGVTDNNPLGIASIRSAVYDTAVGCVVETVHTHNGIHYSGHYNNDGHGHYGLQADNVCGLVNCEETGLHQHNGTHYAGHAGNDGHHGNGHHA
jgi:hypothetical protein